MQLGDFWGTHGAELAQKKNHELGISIDTATQNVGDARPLRRAGVERNGQDGVVYTRELPNGEFADYRGSQMVTNGRGRPAPENVLRQDPSLGMIR